MKEEAEVGEVSEQTKDLPAKPIGQQPVENRRRYELHSPCSQESVRAPSAVEAVRERVTVHTKVPPNWSAVELSEVVDIAYGKNLPTTKLIDRGFEVYGANGQIGFYSEYNCEESEVLITCRGATCGTINVSPPKTFVTNNSMVLRPHDPTLIDRNYLRAAMLATDKSKVITGTAQPQITVANLSKHRIGLAPLNEQRRIVAKIEELTARSRGAKEALDAIPPLLERFRQSVLAAAFRGDLTKRWREQNPDVEPATELLKRIRQERRQRWEEDYLAQQKAKGKAPKDDKWKAKYQEPEPVDTTGLPELPEGWCGPVAFLQTFRLS